LSSSGLFLALTAWIARLLPPPIRQGIYRVKPLANLIRRMLNRAAPSQLAEVAVAAGDLQGVRMLLDLQREKDYWLGTYEPELQAAIRDWVSPGTVAYDIGANIGYVSLLLARQVGSGGQVIAFEALPENLERLRSNLGLSNLGGCVQALPFAVIDGERPVHFLVGPSHGTGKVEGSAGRQDMAYRTDIEVPGISLDHFVYHLDNPPPRLVKMDIEGGEVLALPGMRRLLRESRPVVLLELHGPESAQAAWKELVGAGYRICRMGAGYPMVLAAGKLDWKAYLVAFPPD
jgi:FkbM family methyltransferase